MQNVIINADDYAMDAGVDAAILKLGAIGSIGSASAMVLSPRWGEAARASQDAPSISFGLHLDFTSEFVEGPFAGQSLTAFVVRAVSGRLDREALRREIVRQLALFETGRKAAPDFVDGHQHVHHLPAVRDELAWALGHRYGDGAKRIGLRICKSAAWRGTKAAIVARTGASGLLKLAAAGGHPVNSDFAGVYDFARDADLEALWRGWTAGLVGPLPLIMCHVASRSDDASRSDPIRAARLNEFAWFSSEAFRSLCQQCAISPVRWPPA